MFGHDWPDPKASYSHSIIYRLLFDIDMALVDMQSLVQEKSDDENSLHRLMLPILLSINKLHKDFLLDFDLDMRSVGWVKSDKWINGRADIVVAEDDEAQRLLCGGLRNVVLVENKNKVVKS